MARRPLRKAPGPGKQKKEFVESQGDLVDLATLVSGKSEARSSSRVERERSRLNELERTRLAQETAKLKRNVVAPPLAPSSDKKLHQGPVPVPLSKLDAAKKQLAREKRERKSTKRRKRVVATDPAKGSKTALPKRVAFLE